MVTRPLEKKSQYVYVCVCLCVCVCEGERVRHTKNECRTRKRHHSVVDDKERMNREGVRERE
jgi:hypothetical protein